MSPDRRGREPYEGPERRSAHRRREDLPPVLHGPFTTWQWAVLGAYFVALILALGVGKLAARADENAHHGNAAICVLVGALENSRRANEQFIRSHPAAPETPARMKSLMATRVLVGQLRAEVPNCRTALK